MLPPEPREGCHLNQGNVTTRRSAATQGFCFTRFWPWQYWIHSGWVVSRIIGVVLYFWVFRGAVLGQEQVDWSFGKFLLAIAGPVTIFMQAHLLLTIDPDSFIDWRSHFYSVRRRFFLFVFIGQASNIVSALAFVTPVGFAPF
jgi:hypothetical protein